MERTYCLLLSKVCPRTNNELHGNCSKPDWNNKEETVACSVAMSSGAEALKGKKDLINGSLFEVSGNSENPTADTDVVFTGRRYRVIVSSGVISKPTLIVEPDWALSKILQKLRKKTN